MPETTYINLINVLSFSSELSRLRGVSPSLLAEDIDALREEVSAAQVASGQSWGMTQVLRCRELRLPLLLACSMQAGQQTSGINAVSIKNWAVRHFRPLRRHRLQYVIIGYYI